MVRFTSHSFAIGARWILGAAAYIAVCAGLTWLCVAGLMAWGHGTLSKFAEMEMRICRIPVFLFCVILGAAYASALAKPACFGNAARIWKHLGVSLFLVLLGCTVLVYIQFMSYPNLGTIIAMRVYLFALFTVAALSFAGAIAAWVRVAFAQPLHQPPIISEHTEA